ncbi:6-phosphogluconolactonase [Aminobacter sp. AP02]|uniref:6-phosphogluconolactonase n=1 Tax=Aminobacter sp. AP02 TaxID=2135737 RepID=UPI000D6BAD12|nr:6-phosphogluconolactonase [Aminobacter sp. AP02]PWK65336.1 6-phosphogluconolactonase [Aminobacter sp. AP02]
MALPRWNEFATREELAAALAAKVADALRTAIAQRGEAFLAVSGGTTPGRFMAALSREELDWNKVTVTLVDERFVPESSPRSNASLAKANLLQHNAAAARFAPLYHEAATVEEAAARADTGFRALPWPLDAAVLGMGGDGHTASFFPDAQGLDALLDPASARIVMPVHAESAGEPRLTLTTAPLINARLLAVHIEGAEKRAVLEAAMAAEKALPIRTVLDRSPRAAEIYWAP